MLIKRYAVIVLSVIVALIGVLAACAAPSLSPTSTSTPTITPTAAPTGPLAQIIAEAKKEGTVTVSLKSTILPKSMERLKIEIKDMFGVDLDIKFNPSSSMDKEVADSIMEHQVGATPSYDLRNWGVDATGEGNKAGILEKVDWKPLITRDTNPEVIIGHSAYLGGLVNYTGTIGMMYNPEKISAAQVPLTLSQLADPKWRGKIAIPSYKGSWSRRSFIMGKEKTLADLRAILKNGAIQGTYAAQWSRYLLSEVWMSIVTSSYLKEARDKGVPGAWQALDYCEETEYYTLVLKGAAHPNAAKLVAIYLASPAGAKFMLEEGAGGNLFYPGNFEQDLLSQAERQGIPIIFMARDSAMVAFGVSDEYAQWQKEIDLILKGGG